MSANNIAVRVENLSKVFPGPVQALDDVTLEVKKGEFLVVIGLKGVGALPEIKGSLGGY